MLERLDETIVAISSAPGRGTVGIVRLSGPRAYELLRLIAPNAGEFTPPARVRDEVVMEGAAFPAVLYLFRAPHSYTRQDLVEIHTVGAPPILQMICEKLVSLGAIPAQPGEFTARAYFNGAMDLVSAEGVARLIRAQSDTQLQAARRMMDGALSVKVLALRDSLAELLGLVEAGIDFAEEPIEFISSVELVRRLRELIYSFRDVQTQARDREVFDPLPRVLLLGPPNAGKSSLMNRLSGRSRAICAAVAGTTRDILSAPIQVGTQEAILLDAAGIDDSTDEVIASARELALSAATTSDFVCVVLDAQKIQFEISNLKSQEAETDSKESGLSNFKSPIKDFPLNAGPSSSVSVFFQELRSRGIGNYLIALNKCDLLEGGEIDRIVDRVYELAQMPVVPISVLRGDGIEELRRALATALQSSHTTVTSESSAFSDRQQASLAAVLTSMARAAALADSSASTTQCADLLAFELREALDAIGAVTGEVTTEDLLTEIFSKFCIGK